MFEKPINAIFILLILCLTLACSSTSLAIETPTPEPTATPIPSPTATPKPLCPLSDFDEMNRYVEQFETFVESGKSIIQSDNIMLQGIALGSVRSWSESLAELEVSECIQPAKDALTTSYEYMDTAFNSTQLNLSIAMTNFNDAKTAFDAYKALVKELTEK